jgi:hypothetical protein
MNKFNFLGQFDKDVHRIYSSEHGRGFHGRIRLDGRIREIVSEL